MEMVLVWNIFSHEEKLDILIKRFLNNNQQETMLLQDITNCTVGKFLNLKRKKKLNPLFNINHLHLIKHYELGLYGFLQVRDVSNYTDNIIVISKSL